MLAARPRWWTRTTQRLAWPSQWPRVRRIMTATVWSLVAIQTARFVAYMWLVITNRGGTIRVWPAVWPWFFLASAGLLVVFLLRQTARTYWLAGTFLVSSSLAQVLAILWGPLPLTGPTLWITAINWAAFAAATGAFWWLSALLITAGTVTYHDRMTTDRRATTSRADE